jgi:hypothetical protein
VFKFLCEMGRLTSAEILAQTGGGHRKHHDQPVASICSEAEDDIRRARLDEIFGDDIFRSRSQASNVSGASATGERFTSSGGMRIIASTP